MTKHIQTTTTGESKKYILDKQQGQHIWPLLDIPINVMV